VRQHTLHVRLRFLRRRLWIVQYGLRIFLQHGMRIVLEPLFYVSVPLRLRHALLFVSPTVG